MNQKPWMPEQDRAFLFDGWRIIDVAVRTKEIIYVLAKKIVPDDEASRIFDSSVLTRIVPIYLSPSQPSPRDVYVDLSGFEKPVLGTSTVPLGQGLVANRNFTGQVFAMGGGLEGDVEYAGFDSGQDPVRICRIRGEAWALGSFGDIRKRTGHKTWTPGPTAELQKKLTRDPDNPISLNDLAGGSEGQLFVVGDRGFFAYWQNRSWERIPFPWDGDLGCVTCTDDGAVYVASKEGLGVWYGDPTSPSFSWRTLRNPSGREILYDTRWFRDQLWLSSEYAVQVLSENSELVQPKGVNPSQVLAGRVMDSDDGILAVCDWRSLVTFDGHAWRTLFAPPSQVGTIRV
jgi:hypothetical protein